MSATSTITHAELIETLGLITTKMDGLRHRIAADEQLTVTEAAELAAAIEEITADTYRLADRLDGAADRAAPRVHARARESAEPIAPISKRALRLVPQE